jgi:transcriptional regulator with XRE-family HTH domain
VDDRRVGLVLRALRRRLGKRQVDVARDAGVSASVVSRAERGHVDTLTIRTVRSLFAAVDARFDGSVRWRGGELDYLLDRAHAELGTAVTQMLSGAQWEVRPEVTFMRFGERGSIDLLAVRSDRRAAAIFELKSEMTSFEEQQRRLDAKARVAASVVEERFLWRPTALGVILVLADTSTNRARVSRVAPLIRSALPAGNVQVRRWLRDPVGDIQGIWFFRDLHRGTVKRGASSPHRVRVPRER